MKLEYVRGSLLAFVNCSVVTFFELGTERDLVFATFLSALLRSAPISAGLSNSSFILFFDPLQRRRARRMHFHHIRFFFRSLLLFFRSLLILFFN